eukprot:6600414-Prymnesium_polylepis.1
MLLCAFAALLTQAAAFAPAAAPVAAFDVLNANRVLHLAWASYCSQPALSNWTCQWCTGPYTFPQKLDLQ